MLIQCLRHKELQQFSYTSELIVLLALQSIYFTTFDLLIPILNTSRYLGKSSFSHFQCTIHLTIYSRVISYFFQFYFQLF